MKTFKKISSCILSTAIFFNLCTHASATKETLALNSIESPFYGYLQDGVFVTADEDFAIISHDDIKTMFADKQLCYTNGGSIRKLLGCTDSGSFKIASDQTFRNGFAQMYICDADGTSIQDYVLHNDGEKISIVKSVQSSEYISVSDDGYILTLQYDNAAATLNVNIQSPTGAVNTYQYDDCKYYRAFGFSYGSDTAAIIMGDNLQINGNYITEGDYYVMTIGCDGKTAVTELGTKYSLSGTGYSDFLYLKTSDVKGREASPYIFMRNTNEVIKINTAPIETAIKDATGSPCIVSCENISFNPNIYDNKAIINVNGNNSYCALIDLTADCKVLSSVYKNISTYDGEIYLAEDFNNKFNYLDKNGKVIAEFESAGEFVDEYAPVIVDNKAYLIDRNMDIVSNGIKADSVFTQDNGLLNYYLEDSIYIIVYDTITKDENATEETMVIETEESLPETEDNSDTVTETPEESKPTDTDTNEKTSPDTGITSVAAGSAVALFALGTLTLSRKKK